MTTLKEIKSLGYNRGYRIGRDCDLIDIGNYVDKYIMGESENVKVTSSNWLDVHTAIISDCESSNRGYSPFESLAHDINEYENKKGWSGDAWREFDEAISRGINRALRERWKSIRMTKEDYWKTFEGSRDLFDECWKLLRREAKHTEIDFNDNKDIEDRLESTASQFVNNPSSRFYIYG